MEREDVKVGFRLVVFVRDAALRAAVVSELYTSIRKKKEFEYVDTTHSNGVKRVKRETGIGIAKQTLRLIELHNHNMVAVYHVYETFSTTIPCDLLIVDTHVLAHAVCVSKRLNPILTEHTPALVMCHLSEDDDDEEDEEKKKKKKTGKKKKRAHASSVIPSGHMVLRIRTCIQYTIACLLVVLVVSFVWVIFKESSALTLRKK